FGSSSVDFEISIWIRDPWKLHQAASDLRLAIWWALKEDEITISYPQLDLHFDKGEPPPFTLISGEGG
ncbi:MAG: small-conductance mechanosensitive channel, partial [Myxococcota bacterium]